MHLTRRQQRVDYATAIIGSAIVEYFDDTRFRVNFNLGYMATIWKGKAFTTVIAQGRLQTGTAKLLASCRCRHLGQTHRRRARW